MSTAGGASPELAARLSIASRWDGTPLPVAEQASIAIYQPRHGELVIELEAPFFDDPPPTAAVGCAQRLWEHEVVEVFFADAAEHYLEVELGAHGHHLVLELAGIRKVVRSGLPLDYSVRHAVPGRFSGVARVPVAYLPEGVCRVNAYAIHGAASARCYHAHATGSRPASAPDFHRLESFVPLQLR